MVMKLTATVCFAFAIAHTFSVKYFHRLSRQTTKRLLKQVYFLCSEVELVFGIWALVFLLLFLLANGPLVVLSFLGSLSFKEPVFVFAALIVCSTRPVQKGASLFVETFSRVLPLPKAVSFYCTALIFGPLLGSFITEPAAMTVTALLLLERLYKAGISERLRYSTLALLFVNISIGGVLTPYAAPPVLMVAGKWGWGLKEMLFMFGWKAVLAVVLSTLATAWVHRRELTTLQWRPVSANAKHSGVQWRQAAFVTVFLSGLVVLGAPQRWWLEPLLARLSALPLFFSATALTAVVDNAALTYLGSQVPSLSDALKYALVAGSVVGGGLTVIANAPNPVGYGILNDAFGKDGISPGLLFLYALVPTAVAAVCFWFL